MAQILVIRIAGQVKNKKVDNETLKRLKLNKKFSTRIINSEDDVVFGMVRAVAHKVAYGAVDETFVKELNDKRPAKEGIHFLHPARGGFKKSSKVAYPKGILGDNKEIVKLAERML
jgi:ribosomal protein L30/L7E